MTDATVPFSLMVAMFQAMVRDRTPAKKRKRFRTFIDRVYTGRDYFSSIRLMLPSLDRERGTYGLKESALAAALVDGLGISKDSDDAKRLFNWRRGGARTGANAGNFALVAAEVLQRRQGLASGGLTIKELNDALNHLATKENRSEKADILSYLIKKTNALEMKWILMIILKDLKLGISEKSIFHEFHPDAEDLFNVTCDLKLVCEKLKDRNQRHKRQDIEVGKPVRPQLAMRVSDPTTAWKKLHGKEVVVECKFDGDRIQMHKNGAEIHFFSRNFLHHPEYAHGMSDVISRNILVERCILDGEMLVWDSSTLRFAEFGSNQEIAKQAREGLESSRQLCYVAFDVLYVGDTSVIHQSLKERHVLLRKTVNPMKGRLEILVPYGGLNDRRLPGEPCWSLPAYNVEDIERFFKETIDNRDEGIVLKDLGSKWEPGDRNGKWLKLKPDYIHAGSDLDVLIIGGYYGSGRRGGEVAQFLLGLAERSSPTDYPKRFYSFCRVGTGLSEEELDALITKLKPYFREYGNPKNVPSFYVVTNNSKERPDVWIDSPDKSVVVSITSDIRTIKSEVFAGPYSLRFPRIQRVRYDKPWHECLDLQSFVDLVHASNGSMQRTEHGGLQNAKRVKDGKKIGKGPVSIVPTHFIQTDISNVKEETLMFTNMMFFFVNTPPSYSVEYFHKIVAENGGNFSMNLNDTVTHCIASEKKGIKYQAAVCHGDVIHYSWVLDCCKEKRLLLLHPKYFLYLSDSSKYKFKDVLDKFSDYFYRDLDITDLKQIFSNMDRSDNVELVKHYKEKYCPVESLCLFHGISAYFFNATNAMNVDWRVISELALRRMAIEVSMRGGEMCNALSQATHLVAYMPSGTPNFENIYSSFQHAQRRRLLDGNLHVVNHQWLEDSVVKLNKLPEDTYNLKPGSFEGLDNEGSMDADILSGINKAEEQPDFLESSRKRKHGGPSNVTTQKKPARTSARLTLSRVGGRLSKIDDESESCSLPSHDSLGKIPAIENIDVDKRPEQHKPEVSRKKREKLVPAVKQIRRAHHVDEVVTDESRSSDFFDECVKQSNVSDDLMKADKNSGGTETAAITGIPEGKNVERFCNPHSAEANDSKDTSEGQDAVGHENVHVLVGQKDGAGEKHEHFVDPIHAMLLDMIPSLSQKVETYPSLSRKVETGKASTSESEKPQANTDAKSVKKKVSYKDVASELLKDW